MIWTTAGETFATTASSELFNSRRKFDDLGGSGLSAAAGRRTSVDCACANVAISKKAIPRLMWTLVMA
jgi:hypothetical protein